jgi:stearoyl-CoA desaturase (delta-9 desaturase)
MPPAIGAVQFDGGKTIWLWGMVVSGAAFGLPSLSARTLLLSTLLAFVTLCVGHSVGLHRGVIHRTYQTDPLVRGALVYLFVLSGLGGPLSWVRLHAARDFWQNRLDCPPYFSYDHSVARDFLWNLHLRFVPADDRADSRLASDILRDPWLRFLERTWPLHVLLLAIAVGFFLGPEAIAVSVCARTAAGILGHWAVGYAAHAVGERPFIVSGAKESGTNLRLAGILSFGEGFHNNHHAHPSSARMGMRWWEIDAGWAVVRALEMLHLVRHVKAWHRTDSGESISQTSSAATAPRHFA